MNEIKFRKYKTGFCLLALTAASLLVHGYHPFAEDAEIYLPGVEKIMNPQLFPSGREFFASHASLTLFPNLIAFSLRLTHLPLEAGLFVWHLVSCFLLLLACWKLSGLLFGSAEARWAAGCMIAALFTLPVAGTALYIMDQYVNPRNLAAFAGIFAVVRTLEQRYVRAALWLAFAGSVHPLMAAFAFSFCALMVAQEKLTNRARALDSSLVAAGLCCWLPFSRFLDPPTSLAYHEAALRHGFHYIQRWQWYEVLGAIAPAALLWWFGRIARARRQNELERMCRALIIYNLVYFVAALIVDLPARFESLARLQPLRSLHLLYILMFIIMGGLLGEHVLKRRAWRWVALFVPLSVGMFLAQRVLFPASAHVEWPGAAPRNPWAQAFVWIRRNTPVDAVFAINPLYMEVPGEDFIGFRALAERSRLADGVKDSGAVSMFPPLAEEWWAQMQAQTPWEKFGAEDFARLKEKYGVSWVIVQGTAAAELDCAYRNATANVCRVR